MLSLYEYYLQNQNNYSKKHPGKTVIIYSEDSRINEAFFSSKRKIEEFKKKIKGLDAKCLEMKIPKPRKREHHDKGYRR